MASIVIIAYLFSVSLVSAIGILAGAFVVAVNLLDWAKGGILSTCDITLVALGISSACFQCAYVGQAYVSMIWREVHGFILPVITQLNVWSGFSSFWLTTCLCVFYCVKIVDFNHHLFIWLKLRISRALPWLLLGSVVGSLAISIPTYWNAFKEFPHNSTTNGTASSTTSTDVVKYGLSYTIVVRLFGFFCPLLLGVGAVTLVLASLCRHARRMKDKASGFSQPRLDAHFGAAKVVGALLLIQVFLMLTEAVRQLSQSYLLHMFLWLIRASAIAAESIVLILGNAKLKQALWKLLSC